jgi:hypothetical protein
MADKKKWLYVMVGGLGALALVIGVGFVMYQTVEAAVGPGVGQRLERISSVADGFVSMRLGRGEGEFPMSGYQEALAEALGISLEELQEAFQIAREAVLDQAVADGRLTEDQVEQFSSFEGQSPHGPRGFVGGSEFDEYLAEALGISVEELQTAKAKAKESMLEQAVEEGWIDEEQLELIQARMDIREYVEEAMSDAYAEAVQSAVVDGVITQEIADRLLSDDGLPFHGGAGFGKGFGGRMGR